MTGVDGLVEFLTARLDEREAVARAATPGPWRWDEEFGDDQDKGLALTNAAGAEIVGAYNTHCCSFRDDPNVSDADRDFIASNDPAFVLADIAAKRRIIELHYSDRGDCALCAGEEDFSDDADGNREWYRQGESHPCRTLRLLAQPFSGHRDYRQEWQPS